jgi:hypothetical protein
VSLAPMVNIGILPWMLALAQLANTGTVILALLALEAKLGILHSMPAHAHRD